MEFGRCSTFHTSNIRCAGTFLYAYLSAPPEGRSLRDALSADGAQKQNAFSARQRYKIVPALLFSSFFSGKTEKNGPAERRQRRIESHHAIGAYEKMPSETPRAIGAHKMHCRRPFPIWKSRLAEKLLRKHSTERHFTSPQHSAAAPEAARHKADAPSARP